MTRSKRRNGDGTVYRRGSGWEAAVTVGGKRRTARAATAREAEEALRRLRALRDTDALPPPGRMTMKVCAEQWLAGPSVGYSTDRRYREIVTLHVLPSLGKRPVRDLKPQDLRRLYVDLAAGPNGLSAQTIVHVHRVVHQICSNGEINGWMLSNPARLVRPPRVDTTRPHVLSIEDVRRLAAGEPDALMGPIFAVSALTGTRLGELLALRWTDTDLAEAPCIEVTQALKRAAKGRVVGTPKTTKSRRMIPLAGGVQRLLVAQRAAQARLRLAAGPAWCDNDLVFTDEIGRHLNPDRVRRRWRTLRTTMGLDDQVSVRSLRHTFASLHLDTGEAIDVVSDLLGHSRPSTTLNIYRVRTPRHHRAAAERLDALLSGGDPEPPVAGGVAGTDER